MLLNRGRSLPWSSFEMSPFQIRVYKNGDERDPGKVILVTRREYKHWVGLKVLIQFQQDFYVCWETYSDNLSWRVDQKTRYNHSCAQAVHHHWYPGRACKTHPEFLSVFFLKNALQFTELENNGEYVAVERGPFIDCNYGMRRMWTQTERVSLKISKWTAMHR